MYIASISAVVWTNKTTIIEAMALLIGRDRMVRTFNSITTPWKWINLTSMAASVIAIWKIAS
jgi:hypothetical protein